jgi:hypothetical protein
VKRERYLSYRSIGFSRKSEKIIAVFEIYMENPGFFAGFLEFSFRFGWYSTRHHKKTFSGEK